MERGIVTHIGVNPQRQRYGFVRKFSGEDVYFNENNYDRPVAISGTLVIPGAGRQYRRLQVMADFPEKGEQLVFVQEPGKRGQRASRWCTSADYEVAERKLMEEEVPGGQHERVVELVEKLRRSYEHGERAESKTSSDSSNHASLERQYHEEAKRLSDQLIAAGVADYYLRSMFNRYLLGSEH